MSKPASDICPAERELLALIDSPSFSGVISVIHRGRVLLEHARGMANREVGTANCLETRFATGSVSKIFTATCLGRMVDAGLCRCDQALPEIVPELRPHLDGGDAGGAAVASVWTGRPH